MADPIVIAVNDQDAPAEYVLSQGEAFRPEMIEATFDGSGAGGGFRPCATLYSPEGRKLARTFPDDAMAAGDTSGVTFAPF